MDTGTYVNERPYTSNNSAGIFRGFDMPLLVAVVALTVFGLVMLYSASWDFSLGAYGNAMYMFNRQLMWLGIGLVIAIILAFFDYHHWRKLVVPALGFTIILLVVVLMTQGILLARNARFLAVRYNLPSWQNWFRFFISGSGCMRSASLCTMYSSA